MSAHSPKKEAAVLGPFWLRIQSGISVLLRRNPNYWKKIPRTPLAYLDSSRSTFIESRRRDAALQAASLT